MKSNSSRCFSGGTDDDRDLHAEASASVGSNDNHIRQIDAFRMVISTETVKQAVLGLDLSRPAVSRVIADLEREVGFKLFDRSRKVHSSQQKKRVCTCRCVRPLAA